VISIQIFYTLTAKKMAPRRPLGELDGNAAPSAAPGAALVKYVILLVTI